MGIGNVPDDWDNHWWHCASCGVRYHASEGHDCCAVCMRVGNDCGCCLECMAEECECEDVDDDDDDDDEGTP